MVAERGGWHGVGVRAVARKLEMTWEMIAGSKNYISNLNSQYRVLRCATYQFLTCNGYTRESHTIKRNIYHPPLIT